MDGNTEVERELQPPAGNSGGKGGQKMRRGTRTGGCRGLRREGVKERKEEEEYYIEWSPDRGPGVYHYYTFRTREEL